MGDLGGVTVGEGGEASWEGVVTRGEWGGDGSTCDSGGRDSAWWLSGAASVVWEEGWGGEREERVV